MQQIKYEYKLPIVCTIRHLLLFVTIIFSVLLIRSADAGILHVGADWSGTKYATIQDAVDAASEGDEVWVEKGTYILSSTINIRKSMSLYGGFAGSETQREQRKWTANATTVDGNSSVRCFQLLVTSTGMVSIDGFTITRGDTTADSTPNGPGIANGIEDGEADGGNLSVVNCVFTLNNSGKHGTISNETNGSLTVSNCTFSGNTAVNRGAAINHNEGAVNMTVTGCAFSGNSAGNAGAIYVKSTTTGESSITDCVFSNNKAHESDGGAIIADQNITITRCTFDQNSCTRNGVFAGRGNNSAVFTNCVFSKNSAKFGAGICLNGGGSYVTGTLEVMNCTFTGNTLLESGKGGAIYTQNAGDNASVFTVTNSIFWGNDGNAIDRSGTTQLLPAVSYSDIDQPGYEGIISSSINQDPLFKDAANGNYSLQATSPCKDTGTSIEAPADDIVKTSRPNGAGVDMGAYEYSPSAATTTTTTVQQVCALTKIANGQSHAELNTLRLFRDRRISRCPEGIALTGLYYLHGMETGDIVLSDPGLKNDFQEIIKETVPALQKALLDDSTIILKKEQYARGLLLLKRIKEQSSPDLNKAISFVLVQITDRRFLQKMNIQIIEE